MNRTNTQSPDPDEFKDWNLISPTYDGFARAGGPFYWRKEDGEIVIACRVMQQHLNADDNMHGGCLMLLGDIAVYHIINNETKDLTGVTVTFNSEFLGPARLGDYVEVRGEVTRLGYKMAFMRGMITANDKPCLSFSSSFKRIRKPA